MEFIQSDISAPRTRMLIAEELKWIPVDMELIQSIISVPNTRIIIAEELNWIPVDMEFIHSFNHFRSFIHSIISVHSFIRSFPFIHSIISFIHSFIHSIISVTKTRILIAKEREISNELKSRVIKRGGIARQG